MIKNYLTIAWRNIINRPFFSVLNITGLFAGISFVLLISAYVWSEVQVNRNLRNAKQQYFLQSKWKDDNMGIAITTLAPVAKRLKEDYPALVANYYRWDGITSGVSKADKSFREGIQLGDSTVLNMYGFELLHGNKATALSEPYSAVITAATAIKYFGKTDVVGESLTIQNFSGGKREFAITGVLKGLSKNSVTNLNESNNNTIFIPANTYTYFGRTNMDDWNNIWIPSYIELKEGASVASVDKAIKQLMQTNASDVIRANLTIQLIPLESYYLNYNNGLVKKMLYTLSFIGLFILLMAVVNFINIAISSAGNRMREIGVRKVLGGMRTQLIAQFLAESFILVLLATLLAMIAYPLLSPWFSEMVGRDIPSLFSFPLYFAALPFALVLLVGLLAGAYPAFVLSSVNTINSLKGKIKTVKENIWLRKSLVGFQFAIALIVLSCAAIVTMQVNYFFSRSLGYNKEFIVSSQVPRDWSKEGVQKMKTIRNEFELMPEISSATISYEIPNGMNGAQPSVFNLGADSTTAVPMQSLVTDENYLSTYQVPLVDGSFFDSRGLDSGKIIVSEKAIKALGYTTNSAAIGRQVRMIGDPTIFTIKGVVKDFHFGSMQSGIQPLVFFDVNTAITHRYLSFKLKPGNVSASIEAIQKRWRQLMPGSAFEYSFMDDTLKKLYATEIQLKKAAYAATALSLVIVFLGVLGLVSLSVQKRVKEIGIRKVLGASISGIMQLFIKEFVMIILVAGCIAVPLAYITMSKWLNNYASHISISAIPFVVSLLLLAMVTMLLIMLQTFKASVANPVKSLRQAP